MDNIKTTHLSFSELMALETRNRANLINSIGGFKSVCLIGSCNSEKQNNLAIFNSIIHIGASPPLIGFIIRPDSVDRHTLSNIIETGYYTINHINESIYQQAHQTSARYPREISEFDATNLTASYKDDFAAPFVHESSIQLGIEFKDRIDIKLNNTILIIGQIVHVNFPKECLCEDGFLDIEKAKTITCSGLDSYHKTERINRLSYAKPNLNPLAVKMKYLT